MRMASRGGLQCVMFPDTDKTAVDATWHAAKTAGFIVNQLKKKKLRQNDTVKMAGDVTLITLQH